MEGINAAMDLLRWKILPSIKIEEYFLVDINKVIDNFIRKIEKIKNVELFQDINEEYKNKNICDIIVHNKLVIRNDSYKLKTGFAFKKYFSNISKLPKENEIKNACEKLKHDLTQFNQKIKEEMMGQVLDQIVNNVRGGIMYRFFDPENANKNLDLNYPLVNNYFSDLKFDENILVSLQNDIDILNDYDQKMYLNQSCLKLDLKFDAKFIVANQGWVMGDSTVNFALPSSKVYLLRELVVWGDSVKLNYGDYYSQNPLLWDYMKKYVISLAKYYIFSNFVINLGFLMDFVLIIVIVHLFIF